ncbi:PcfJ domain-containing protein [Viridibacillus arvi]|uniref:PcfJ domain-containing protein n=1 Tax=Viridibacillus arvi TaxID=263475 RepID=UPI0034CF45A7
MTKLTKKDLIEQYKTEIRDAEYLSHEAFTDGRYETVKKIGTMYIKEKMDYGFHIFFIHEPSDSNKLAGINGVVSEMYYDLRNRNYWIKRNMKEVKFSARNVDSIFPYKGNSRKEIFDKLSTDANKGLYESAFKALGKLGEEKVFMYGRFLHRLITGHSYYELLYKAGIELKSEMRIVNRKGTSPREVLGLSKTQWKLYTKYGCSQEFLSYKDDNMADNKAIGYLAYIEKLEEEYGLDKTKQFINREFSFIYGSSSYRSALQVAKRYNLPDKKFIRYIYFECDVSQGIGVETAISEYEDYIRMTTEMGYERFDRYPKHLRTSHDIASRNYKVKLDAKELEQWRDALESNKSYISSVGDYMIFPPETPEDLVKEGNVLGHCVGSYVNKVRKGISTILFLREKTDVDCPLVTIEVRDNRIVQARGKMNYPPTSNQKLAVDKFAKKFRLVV